MHLIMKYDTHPNITQILLSLVLTTQLKRSSYEEDAWSTQWIYLDEKGAQRAELAHPFYKLWNECLDVIIALNSLK